MENQRKEQTALSFSKLHGLGNDYLFIDSITSFPSLTQIYDIPQLAIQLSDRHFGIGSDGLILVLPSSLAHFKMRMFNADGSEGQMCGNGIRCAVKFALDNKLVPIEDLITVETLAGVLSVTYTRNQHGKVDKVKVDMGKPKLKVDQIPALIEGVDVAIGMDIDLIEFGEDGWWIEAGVLPQMTLVSMGNPHVVFICKGDPKKIELEKVGKIIENDRRFPSRINVHFAQFNEDGTQAEVRTWERGSGITLACGTGACSVCVAGFLLGIGSNKLIANLPGGPLQLEWESYDSSVIMEGPATYVFDASINASKIERCLLS